MANIKSAAKRVRQNVKIYRRNRSLKKKIKDARKVVTELKKLTPEGIEAVSALQKALDKAVKKNVIHPNRANRIKSRLMARLKS